MPSDALDSALEDAYASEQRRLWGLCYRMTGSGADADDLVQDTWLRALERPPADLEAPLRPWLARVATNLALDSLRARKARSYTGSWLPAPVPDEKLEIGPTLVAPHDTRPDARYGLAESATLAFLIALEALSPTQRAVLLLRDVYQSSVRETAEATGLSEANVKTTLHRARKALEQYDASPCRPTPEFAVRVRSALEAFALAVASADPSRIAAVFRKDAELWSDANGEFLSNLRPLQGAAPISRFYASRSRKLGGPDWFEVVQLNHLPCAVFQFGPQENPRLARRFAMGVLTDDDGRIARLWNVAATDKLCSLTRLYPPLQELPFD